MKKTQLPLLALLLSSAFTSCMESNPNPSNSESESKEEAVIAEIVEENEALSSEEAGMEYVWIMEETEVTSVSYEDFKIYFNSTLTLEAANISDELLTADSVFLYADLGSNLDDRPIYISSANLTNITVAQAAGMTITLMNEGPHCDLYTVPEVLTPWKNLEDINEDLFRTLGYEELSGHEYPSVDLESVRSEVLSYCGEEWYALSESATSIKDYPFGIGISTYYFRITGTRASDGSLVTKIIGIELPMGC